MLRQSLAQKMSQKLSPAQIQLMKLLQIPTATLDDRISEEMEVNPALEEGEENQDVFDLQDEDSEDNSDEVEFELDEYLNEYLEEDPSSYKTNSDTYSLEETKTIPIAVETSFHEKLSVQLGMMYFENLKEENTAKQIVGSIDEDGYLRREPISIVDDIMFAYGYEVGVEDVEYMLKKIQKFDPPGVGARDLQECLIIQLEQKINKSDKKQRSKTLALKILKDYFNEFIKKHYEKLKRTHSLSDSELKEAIEEITRLNPKPASGVQGQTKSSHHYIVPDFLIYNREGELELTLNSKNAPDLRINDHYAEMLKGYKATVKGRRSTKQEKEAILFIKQKIDSARWFIDAIKQRQDTLYRTMYSIMQFQLDFFQSGDERRIRPMILKDIAEITGLDISTVSRVANSKFVQTEFGTKKLKSFFSESMKTLDGKEVSTLEVKNIMADIIDREDKRKPHSDEKLKDLLTLRGYSIARRTVAKYREQLNISVARLRKTL